MSQDVPDWAAELVRDGRVARLGTADASGCPLVVPVCYAFDGRSCYTAIDPKPKRVAPGRLRRLRNIAANPQVSLVVDRYDEEWTRLRYVIVEGRAEVLPPGVERGYAIDLLITKYPQYRALGLDREASAVIKITPVRFVHWRYA